MAGESHKTTDHEEIREWAEERGGKPATVTGTERDAEQAGVLRIEFPDYGGSERLEEISWDEWFDKFEAENLAVVMQEETKEGGTSRFAKVVDR